MHFVCQRHSHKLAGETGVIPTSLALQIIFCIFKFPCITIFIHLSASWNVQMRYSFEQLFYQTLLDHMANEWWKYAFHIIVSLIISQSVNVKIITPQNSLCCPLISHIFHIQQPSIPLRLTLFYSIIPQFLTVHVYKWHRAVCFGCGTSSLAVSLYVLSSLRLPAYL